MQQNQPAPLPRRIVSIALSDEILERLERARGREARSAFVSRVLDQVLERPPEPPPGAISARGSRVAAATGAAPWR